VGCQNYDDQFSNLESQINALASTVAGLSQVQSDLSSLSGTVSSLSSTVAALGSQFDTSVSNGLADITADIAALQDALVGVASSSELDAVIAAVASQQATLD
jgi:ABC-type transporter Mla subunit MlaD